MTKENFLKDINAWGSHRKLLWEALEHTKKLPVVELGSGMSSTPFLRQYCQDKNVVFKSYESNREWAKTMDSTFVESWDDHNLWGCRYSVCLLDMAPGEYRKIALMKINALITVIHDSEPPGWNASNYQVRPLFSKFKYVIDDIPKEKGQPWTSCLSNTVDVTKFKI
jgi:hypothetical protein